MKAISKDFWREVKNTRSRFISIMILVSLAVAFFSGLRSTAPDMKNTLDAYMDQQNFMDIQVMSTMGLTAGDVEALAAHRDVREAEGAYVIDAFATAGSLDTVVKVYSMPRRLNLLTVVEGRMPERADECVVDAILLSKLGIGVGDTVCLRSEGDYADALTEDVFTVVGRVRSPYYISGERGTSSLGTGQVSAYLYVPEAAFDMDIYTAVYLTVEGAEAQTAYYEGYTSLVDGVIEALEPLGEERAKIRYEEVVADANRELDEAQLELEDARREVEAELADARQELADAREQLDDGWRELEDGRSSMATEKAKAEKEIADGEKKLADAKVELDAGEKSYQSGFSEFEEGRKKYEDGLAEYESGLAEITAAREELDAAEAELDQAAEEIADGKTQLKAAKAELEKSEDQFDMLVELVRDVVNTRNQTTGGQKYLSNRSLLSAMEKSSVRSEVNAALEDMYDVCGLTAKEIVRRLNWLDLSVTRAERTEAETALDIAYNAARDQFIDQGVLGENALLLALSAEQTAAAAAELLGREAETPLADGVEQILREFRKALVRTDGTRKLITASYIMSLQSQIENGWAEYEAGEKELAAGQQEYYSGLMQIAAAEVTLAAAEAEIAVAGEKLAEAEAEIAAGRQELADARKQLDDGWAEYNKGVKKLDDARATLSSEMAKAEKKLADAEQKLNDGEAEYADGVKKYAEGEAEAMEELANAEEEMADARRKVAEIEECTWYILSRDTNPGYLGFGQDADRMGNLASVFPMLFFLVAALVCLTTMTRMVEEQRTQIGCLKALGYTKWTISRKYLGYGLLPSLLGSGLGLLIGYTLFPTMIFVAYQIMYEVPDIRLAQYTDISLFSVLMAVSFTTVSTLAACLATLSDVPANLMRARAPKAGKRVLLEYIRPLWRRMSFNHKVTARNLFRYQKRFWMTVVGIGGCTALIIAGFGLRSSLLVTMDRQYGELYHYSAQLALATSVLEEEKAEIAEAIAEDRSISAWLDCYLGAVTAESDSYSQTAYLQTVDAGRIGRFVVLRDFETGEALKLNNNGVIVTQKLAELLDLSVGDTCVLDGDSRVSVRISGITEHYLSHFVYMTPEYYQQVYGDGYASNAYLLTFADESTATADAVFGRLMSLHGVASATRMLDTKDTYHHSMERIDFVVVIVILCAAALAVVVLFNLSNINITERQRELATIKVLGFHDGEVSAYVNRENVVLTVVGIALGIVMGNWLHMWLVRSVEIDLMMFGRETDPVAYLWAAVLTALFSAAVNGFGFLKMRKIDMVESLKSAE